MDLNNSGGVYSVAPTYVHKSIYTHMNMHEHAWTRRAMHTLFLDICMLTPKINSLCTERITFVPIVYSRTALCNFSLFSGHTVFSRIKRMQKDCLTSKFAQYRMHKTKTKQTKSKKSTNQPTKQTNIQTQKSNKQPSPGKESRKLTKLSRTRICAKWSEVIDLQN